MAVLWHTGVARIHLAVDFIALNDQVEIRTGKFVDQDYKDLEDYGVVGNLLTTAHVCSNGSIDWLCFPRINSPSVFARLLDAKKGGYLCLQPTGKFESVQSYIHDTNILETTFTTASGILKFTDFMHPADGSGNGDRTVHGFFRKITGIEGTVDCSLLFMPRMNYARSDLRLEIQKEGILAKSDTESVFLRTGIPCRVENLSARGVVTYNKDDEDWLVLSYNGKASYSSNECGAMLAETESFWKGWINARTPSQYRYGRWHDLVIRSGLALKMLINARSGAIIAAPTTSLPEDPGGVRNWDYRFAWIRDGVFTMQALYHLGLHHELAKFRQWIDAVIRELKHPGELQPVYGIFPEDDLNEINLDHFAGYRGSRPVRVGNLAAGQLQLDIVGELVNVFYEGGRYGLAISEDQWPLIRELVDYLSTIWMKKDSGIWEIRGDPRHFVYSKMMCWVAFDRALKIARKYNFPMSENLWLKARREVREIVLREGYSDKMGSFRRSFNVDTVDATGLMTGIMKFLPSDDPRVVGTINRIMDELVVKDCLVYRYKENDGLPGKDNPFLPCSFWLVKALALCGRLAEAEEIFRKLVDYISPLGLLSEEIDSKSGRLLGNYPQAFSHLGLINSAIYMAAATQGGELNLAGMADNEEYGWD